MKAQDIWPQLFIPTNEKAEKAKDYYQRPITVTPEFRALILKHYPQLATVQDAEFCWRVIQHILFSDFTDKFEYEVEPGSYDSSKDNRLVLSHIMVAHMAGKKAYDGHFTSLEYFERFSSNIFPLNETDWSALEGRARVIDPSIEKSLYGAAKRELQKPQSERTVFFHNGKVVNPINSRNERKSRASVLTPVTSVSLAHPAYQLAEFLNAQKQGAVSRIIRSNWPNVECALEEMEKDTTISKEVTYSVRVTMAHIQDDFHIYYKAAADSPRVFAKDSTIHGLPSELRKIALGGMVEMDLKACQLAVVAAKWGVPELNDVLFKQINDPHQTQDIWRLILEQSGAKNEDKPILKDTVYSLVFGMTNKHLREQLAEGSYKYRKVIKADGRVVRKKGKKKNEGVGEELADKILKIPFFASILAARKRKLAQLKSDGYLLDAFDNPVKTHKYFNTLSVLAYVAQSYELKIMLSLIPIVKSEGNQIHVASWLHDGVTLYFGKTGEEERQIEQINKKVNKTAWDLGIPTKLEVTKL